MDMQQSKTKLKTGELQTYLDNDNQTAECLQDVIKFVMMMFPKYLSDKYSKCVEN